MITKILKSILKPISGKLRYQRFFENLNELSLAGMNIGGGAEAFSSGEELAIQLIKKQAIHENEVVLFDVGANVGNYCILLEKIFGYSGTIYAFEPSSSIFKILSENTKNLKRTSLFNFGFSNKEEIVNLHSFSEDSGLSSIYNRRLDHFDIKVSSTEKIQLYTIDSFCKNNGINRIDLLKLDVEGNELNILEGSFNMIKSGMIKNIQFEFGGCNIDSKTYFQDFFYLLNPNYQIYRIVKDGIYPITKYREMYEAFTTTNYIAFLR